MKKFNLDDWLKIESDSPMTPNQLLANLIANAHIHYTEEHKRFVRQVYGKIDNAIELSMLLNKELNEEV